jgi:ABC-2 type transport system ATP-binding protein
MGTFTLEADRLTKRYGARTAVDALSFTAGPGDVVGLLGPNGAGKTTTIRLLTTILQPSSGDFSVAGIPSAKSTEIRRRIGVLPERAGYPAHQTGAAFLRYHARLFGFGKRAAEKIAEQLLADVGLTERGGTLIGTYSRGMRQRLGIARSLVNDPAVVFLDEPALGLDPAGQVQVGALIREIARRGTTVVVSTHTLHDVEELCTSVLILDRGKILVAGTPAEVAREAGVPRLSDAFLALTGTDPR